MISAWQVKLFLRATGFCRPLTKMMPRTHGCSFTPSVNTEAVTCLRAFATCNKSFPLSQSSCMSVSSSTSRGDPVVASGILSPKNSCLCINRRKSKRTGRKKNYQMQKDDTDSDEDDGGIELEAGADFRDIRVKVTSLRMDALLKAGLNMSRNKVEAAFYSSNIRINGEKFLKKSHQCHEGDEIDVIKGVSRQNPDNLHVSRVVLMDLGAADEEDDKVTVTLRRYPNLLIERYEDYEPPEQE